MPNYLSVVPTADVATSGSANTLADHLRVNTVSRDVTIVKLDLVGKDAAATNMTGIELDLIRYGVSSTGGSAITPQRRNYDNAVATSLWFTGPTAGSTPAYQWGGGMMSAGQGGFVPIDPSDDGIFLNGSSIINGNCDVESQTEGTSGKNFKYTIGFVER